MASTTPRISIFTLSLLKIRAFFKRSPTFASLFLAEEKRYQQTVLTIVNYIHKKTYVLNMSKIGELQGLESGPERGGIVSVIELAMAKQVYKKNWSYYDMTSWSLAEVLTVLTWRPLSKKF